MEFSLQWLLLWFVGSRHVGFRSYAPWPVESSQTRNWTCVLCIGRQVLNHWATRGISVPILNRDLCSGSLTSISRPTSFFREGAQMERWQCRGERHYYSHWIVGKLRFRRYVTPQTDLKTEKPEIDTHALSSCPISFPLALSSKPPWDITGLKKGKGASAMEIHGLGANSWCWHILCDLGCIA